MVVRREAVYEILKQHYNSSTGPYRFQWHRTEHAQNDLRLAGHGPTNKYFWELAVVTMHFATVTIYYGNKMRNGRNQQSFILGLITGYPNLATLYMTTAMTASRSPYSIVPSRFSRLYNHSLISKDVNKVR
jgi:hypothetical protein